MPSYGFRCGNGHEFEVQRPISRHPKDAMCPACGEQTEKRVYRINIKRAREQVSAPIPHTLEPRHGPAAIVMPAYRPPDGSPSGQLSNTSISGFPTGIVVPPGGYTVAERLRIRGARVAIDNSGRFDGPDTKIE